MPKKAHKKIKKLFASNKKKICSQKREFSKKGEINLRKKKIT